MAHTNRARVVLGGLLAGVVINLAEFVENGIILKADWAQAMQALGKSAQPSGSAIAIYNLWGFLVGITAVWIYAAIRPRYGAGVGTAVRAGVVAWFLGVVLANVAYYPSGVFPGRLLVITSVVALFEIIIATTLGAWIYKEESASTVRSAAA